MWKVHGNKNNLTWVILLLAYLSHEIRELNKNEKTEAAIKKLFGKIVVSEILKSSSQLLALGKNFEQF